MSFLVLVLIFAPAFVAGLGVISPNWMVASAIIAYGKSIMAASDQSADGGWREVEEKQFWQREKSVKLNLLRYVLLIAFFYGVGYLFSYVL